MLRKPLLLLLLYSLLALLPAAQADVTLPEDLTVISKQAFMNNSELTGTLTIPDGVTTISAQAFAGCSGLTQLVLPESVTSIEAEAFSGCTGLTGTVYVSAECAVAADAFAGCDGVTLERLPSPADYFEYTISNGEVTITGFAKEYRSTCLKIPQTIDGYSVTTLGLRSFADCDQLTEVLIPDSVITIEERAFSSCDNLVTVIVGDNVGSIGTFAFSGCKALTTINFPDSVTALGTHAFESCYSLSDIVLPRNWTTLIPFGAVNESPFRGSGLTTAQFPDHATSIPANAFYDVTSLKSITLPDTLTSIGASAFYRCSALEKITIPAGVTIIDGSVFKKCSSLVEVILPDGLTTIKQNAFEDCTSLVSIHLPDSITTLYNHVFKGCKKLEQANYPFNWTTKKHWSQDKAYYASPFSGTVIKKMVIPENVTSIPDYAFYHTYFLTMIHIPSSVTSIGDHTFILCPSLTIYGEPGSYAQTYADENNIPFSTDPFPGDLEGDVWVTLSGAVALGDGTALPGAVVTLYRGDSVTPVATAVTGADGLWHADKLLPDTTYRIACEKASLTFEDVYCTTGSQASQAPALVAATGDAYLLTSLSVIRPEAAAASTALEIISSGAWTASADAEWITLSAEAGSAPGQTIDVSVAENQGGVRVGYILFTGDGQSVSIPVVQPGAAGARLDVPTITSPAADGLELPYDAVTVTWDAVENAAYYVISLRDITTGTLLIHHEKQADSAQCTALLPAEYFFMGREYRIAVGAVPPGLPSTDATVGWCERVFTTPAQVLATDATISGRVCEYEYISEVTDEDGNILTEATINMLPLSNITVDLFQLTETEKLSAGSMVTGEDGLFTFTGCAIGADYVIELTSTDMDFTPLSDADVRTLASRTNTTADLSNVVHSLSTDAGVNTTGDITGVPKLGADLQSNLRTLIAGRPHGLWAEYFQFRDGKQKEPFTNANKRWEYGYSIYDFKNGELKPHYQNTYIQEIDFRWTEHAASKFALSSGTRTNYTYLAATRYDGSGSGLPVRYVSARNFAAHFNGYVQIPADGEYTFRLCGDDGIILSLRQTIIKDGYETYKELGGGFSHWKNSSYNVITTRQTALTAGTILPVDIKYYNHTGVAKVKFEYRTKADKTWRIVPAQWLYMGKRLNYVDDSWIRPAISMKEIDDQVAEAFDNMTDQVLGNYIDKIIGETVTPVVFSRWDDQIAQTWVQQVITSGYQGVARSAYNLLYTTLVDAALDPATLTLDNIWQGIVGKIPCLKEYGGVYGLDLEQVGDDAFETLIKALHILSQKNVTTYRELKLTLDDIVLYDQMESSMTGELATGTLLDKMGTFSTASSLINMYHTNYQRVQDEMDMNRLRSYLHLSVMEKREKFEQSPPHGPLVNGSSLWPQMLCSGILQRASLYAEVFPLPDRFTADANEAPSRNGLKKYYVEALDAADNYVLMLWFDQYYDRENVEVMLYKQLLLDTVNMAGAVYGEALP